MYFSINWQKDSFSIRTFLYKEQNKDPNFCLLNISTSPIISHYSNLSSSLNILSHSRRSLNTLYRFDHSKQNPHISFQISISQGNILEVKRFLLTLTLPLILRTTVLPYIPLVNPFQTGTEGSCVMHNLIVWILSGLLFTYYRSMKVTWVFLLETITSMDVLNLTGVYIEEYTTTYI